MKISPAPAWDTACTTIVHLLGTIYKVKQYQST